MSKKSLPYTLFPSNCLIFIFFHHFHCSLLVLYLITQEPSNHRPSWLQFLQPPLRSTTGLILLQHHFPRPHLCSRMNSGLLLFIMSNLNFSSWLSSFGPTPQFSHPPHIFSHSKLSFLHPVCSVNTLCLVLSIEICSDFPFSVQSKPV